MKNVNIKMIRVTLESLDNKPITERTGRTKCDAEMSTLPYEGGYSSFYYTDSTIESPGVQIGINGLEQMKQELRFVDCARRPFKVTILEE